MVIGYGGGSALDTGKAISILLNNPGDIIDYLEVIGKGERIKNPPIPYFAIPTTSGTGAEVTRNAVIGSKAHKVKVSLRSPMMMAKAVIVDPEITALERKDTQGLALKRFEVFYFSSLLCQNV